MKTSESIEEKDMKYVICRNYSAGVFAGYLESRNGKEVVIRNALALALAMAMANN